MKTYVVGNHLKRLALLMSTHNVWFHGEIRKIITKTYLYNFDPLKPHFYIVKLGLKGVYIIFFIFAQKIDCGYSLEPPRRGGSNEYHNLYLSRMIKNIRIFI